MMVEATLAGDVVCRKWRDKTRVLRWIHERRVRQGWLVQLDSAHNSVMWKANSSWRGQPMLPHDHTFRAPLRLKSADQRPAGFRPGGMLRGMHTMVTEPSRFKAGDMGVAFAMDRRCSMVRGSGRLPITSPPIRLWFLLIDCDLGRLERPCMKIHKPKASGHDMKTSSYASATMAEDGFDSWDGKVMLQVMLRESVMPGSGYEWTYMRQTGIAYAGDTGTRGRCTGNPHRRMRLRWHQ